VLSSISPSELDFGHPPSFNPASQIRQLQESIERAPKKLKWKLRAKVGERAIWYEEPEEVAHLPACYRGVGSVDRGANGKKASSARKVRGSNPLSSPLADP
jgi:hypothetical protein